MYRDDFRARIEQIVRAKNESSPPWPADGRSSTPARSSTSIAAMPSGWPRTWPTRRPILLDAVEAGRRVLFEGAQGRCWTSTTARSPSSPAATARASAFPPARACPAATSNKVVGVLKAYTTRVGGGPFPTEQDNAIGEHIRHRGNEYGTVTRRPRRCGWFDAVAARYTARLSGVDALAVMLLDVLSELPELKICTAYELDGRRIVDFPSHVDDLRRVVPVYETLPGWSEEIDHAATYGGLPEAARRYVARIGALLGRPVEIVSIGPDRRQTIFVTHTQQ